MDLKEAFNFMQIAKLGQLPPTTMKLILFYIIEVFNLVWWKSINHIDSRKKNMYASKKIIKRIGFRIYNHAGDDFAELNRICRIEFVDGSFLVYIKEHRRDGWDDDAGYSTYCYSNIDYKPIRRQEDDIFHLSDYNYHVPKIEYECIINKTYDDIKSKIIECDFSSDNPCNHTIKLNADAFGLASDLFIFTKT